MKGVWRHHQQVVLPVVFIFADGHFLSSCDTLSPDENFETEALFLCDIIKNVHKDMLDLEVSAVDAVTSVLKQLSSGDNNLTPNAFVMDGNTKKSGSIANFPPIHGVEKARYVLDNLDYFLLCGNSASDFIDKKIDGEFDGLNAAEKVFDKEKPMRIYVIAADKNASMSCGAFEQSDSCGYVPESVVIGASLYADSEVGAAMAVRANADDHIGDSLAWLVTQWMREHETDRKDVSLASQIASSLQNYVFDEDSVVFALHKSKQGGPTLMEMSMFCFAPPGSENIGQNGNKITTLATIAGGKQLTTDHFFWSTILPDLRHLSSSALFGCHPYTGEAPKFLRIKAANVDEESPVLHPVCILVHGGAGAGTAVNTSIDYYNRYMEGVKGSALAGYKALSMDKCSAVEAVRTAVSYMENQKFFNAGSGSSLTRTGHVETDAIVHDGKTSSFASVGTLRNVKNPVNLCSKLLSSGDTSIDGKINGKIWLGTNALLKAKELGAEICDESEMISEKAKLTYKKWLAEHQSATKFGTVGAVAIDCYGNIAAATSTGGLTGKIDGRVGDSCIPGCGTMADNHLGAASATGIGEHIAATCMARACLHFMEQGEAV